MKNKAKILPIILAATLLAGCSSMQRACVDLKSDLSGGLDRVINIYTANGELLATYEGKIDLAATEGGYLKFDYEGKRYIYYNCFVESIANISSD